MKLIHLPPDGTYGARIIDIHAIFCVASSTGPSPFFMVTSHSGANVAISRNQADWILLYIGAEQVVVPPAPENAKTETGAEILFPMG